jgi:hypothetical protein
MDLVPAGVRGIRSADRESNSSGVKPQTEAYSGFQGQAFKIIQGGKDGRFSKPGHPGDEGKAAMLFG